MVTAGRSSACRVRQRPYRATCGGDCIYSVHSATASDGAHLMAQVQAFAAARAIDTSAGAKRSNRGQPHLVLVSPDHPRIAVLVTPWPKPVGRARLTNSQRAELALVRRMLAPFLLIL